MNSERKILLEVNDLSVSFNGFQALENVNMKIYEGELRVIIGPNGAGKTTLIDILTGKTLPTSGKVLFEGKNIIGKSSAQITRDYHIGRKFQGPNVFDNMTVKENIEIAIENYNKLINCVIFRRTEGFANKITEILKLIELEDYRFSLAGDLSHGQRQWLEIGMVVAQNPKVIILDEPTAGMTADETYKTGEMIKKLKGDHTLIVVEHDMDFVRQVSEFITVFNYGKLLAEGSIEEVQNNEEVVAVYLKEV